MNTENLEILILWCTAFCLFYFWAAGIFKHSHSLKLVMNSNSWLHSKASVNILLWLTCICYFLAINTCMPGMFLIGSAHGFHSLLFSCYCYFMCYCLHIKNTVLRCIDGIFQLQYVPWKHRFLIPGLWKVMITKSCSFTLLKILT